MAIPIAHLRLVPRQGVNTLEHLAHVLGFYGEGCRIDVEIHGVDPDTYSAVMTAETVVGRNGTGLRWKRLRLSAGPDVEVTLFPDYRAS